VVLVVVDAEGLLTNVGLKSGVVVGKRGQLNTGLNTVIFIENGR
jgi:hypothetical protein